MMQETIPLMLMAACIMAMILLGCLLADKAIRVYWTRKLVRQRVRKYVRR